MNRAQTLSTLVKVAKLQQKLLTKLASEVSRPEINFEFGTSHFDNRKDYYVDLKTTYSGTCNGEQFKVEINRKLFIKCDSEGNCSEEHEAYLAFDNLSEYRLYINDEYLGDGDYIHDNHNNIYRSMDTEEFTNLLLNAWDLPTFQKKLEKEKEECETSHDDRASNISEHRETDRIHSRLS